MRKLLVVVLALLLVSPFSLRASDYKALFASVAPLQAVANDVLRNVCTVTSIDASKHYWLTAAHCIAINPDEDGTRYVNGDLASIVANDPNFDLAVVATERAYAPAAKIAKVGPKYGDPLTLVGHPHGFSMPFLTFGNVANPSYLIEGDTVPMMFYTTVAAPGHSGSAVFNAEGEVVSVLQVGFGQRTFTAMLAGATYPNLVAFLATVK